MFSRYFNVYLCRDHDVLKIKLINHLYSKQSNLTWVQSSWEENDHFKVYFPCENDTMRALLIGLFEAIFLNFQNRTGGSCWSMEIRFSLLQFFVLLWAERKCGKQFKTYILLTPAQRFGVMLNSLFLKEKHICFHLIEDKTDQKYWKWWLMINRIINYKSLMLCNVIQV